MRRPERDSYDVIIIGAGIGGLVCGCYLAKAGLKVLIAEQHSKPGGYCTSFTRGEFTFDAAAHSFGGYQRGNLGKILDTLAIGNRVAIRKYDPSDVVLSPDHRVVFGGDPEQTAESIGAAFPDERNNVRNFINFIVAPDPASFVQLRSWTFENLLDKYFQNEKLKAVLSFPLFGNSGLPPSMLSAFIGSRIFSETLLDGGYFPEGGMQALSDALAQTFEELGGELRLSCAIRKIKCASNAVSGVIADKDGFIPSAHVVSNGDARRTFFTLVGKQPGSSAFYARLRAMSPSLSMFILYLGVKEYLSKWPQQRTNIWYLSHYDLDRAYASATSGKHVTLEQYIVHFIPEKKILVGFLNAPYRTKRYWDKARHALQGSFIDKIETDIAPSLASNTIYRGSATPHTLCRYTSNFKGASYGWESVPTQFADYQLRNPAFIRGLFLAGHWTTQGHGIPGVAYSGWATAEQVLKTVAKKSSL